MPKPQKSYLQRVSHWAHLKQYQFEITFAINVYTRSERIFFWSVLLFLITLTLYATIFFVPRNLLHIAKCILTYVLGDHSRQQEMGKLISVAVSNSVGAASNEAMSIQEAAIQRSVGLAIH
jgi:hypothetical protein